METRVFYDKEYDNLLISQKTEGEKVKKNFKFDDSVISLTGGGKIVSIEITGASNYLRELGFDPLILDNIESGSLVIKPRKDFVFIGFQILGKINSVQQRIPVATIPINCTH